MKMNAPSVGLHTKLQSWESFAKAPENLEEEEDGRGRQAYPFLNAGKERQRWGA